MHLIMETVEIIYLDVKTVPAFDSETKMPHTAYTVVLKRGNETRFASAWTLQDSILLFRKIYNVDEKVVIKLRRPFRPQYFPRQIL